MSDKPTCDSEDENILHVQFGVDAPGSSGLKKSHDGGDISEEEPLWRLFDRLLDTGIVMVTVDSRRDDVVVPEHLKNQIQLNLNWSRSFHLDDFEYDERGVRGSLSFGGNNLFCDLPWESIWVLKVPATNHMVPIVKHAPVELRKVLGRAFSDSGSSHGRKRIKNAESKQNLRENKAGKFPRIHESHAASETQNEKGPSALILPFKIIDE